MLYVTRVSWTDITNTFFFSTLALECESPEDLLFLLKKKNLIVTNHQSTELALSYEIAFSFLF